MLPQGLPVSILIAFAIGAIHTYLITMAWLYIGAYSPHAMWLLTLNAPEPLLLNALFCIDFMTNLVLCLPAAILLCKLRPHALWLYLSMAILPGFFWLYGNLFEDAALLQDWLSFLPGAIMVVFPMPIAAYVLRRNIMKSDHSRSTISLST